MSNRAAVLAFSFGSFRVDVDPLMIVGDVGEFIDALLIDVRPIGDAEFATDQLQRLVDGRESVSL